MIAPADSQMIASVRIRRGNKITQDNEAKLINSTYTKMFSIRQKALSADASETDIIQDQLESVRYIKELSKLVVI